MLRITVTRFILLLALVCSWSPSAARAAVTVSIPDGLCAEPGAGDIDVPIVLDNDEEVRGIQFGLRDTPDELAFSQIDCTTRTNGFLCDAFDPGDNAINTLIVALGGQTIAPGTGDIATIRLTDPAPFCMPGDTVALDIENLIVSDAANQPIEDRIAVSGSFTCGCPTTTTSTSSTTSTSTTTSTTTSSSTSSSTTSSSTTSSSSSSSTSSTSSSSTSTSSSTSSTNTSSTVTTSSTTTSSTTSSSTSSSSTTSTTTSSTTSTSVIGGTTSSTSTSSSTSTTSSTFVTTSTVDTTVTTFTTTTTFSSTTTSTTLAGLVPGGPSSKTVSDCYLALRVVGVENGTSSVEDNRTVRCTDGDPCDLGPCGDDRCDLRVASCVNQLDPNLPDCVPPTGGLQSARLRSKLELQAPSLLTDPACTAFVDVGVDARFDKAGRYLVKKSRAKVKGKARALPGTKPRTDSDRWILQCLPRLTACPAAAR